ncbi:MAG: transcriptional repressor LexA [Actinomycetota bacterium]|nr:transcriptional repressor LexA [Actinomycetota bacterium]
MERLSKRQREILDLIRRRVAERGYPPSVREIGEEVGLSSPSTVHSHLSALVRSGHLRRDPTKPRAIEVVELSQEPETLQRSPTREVPLVGRIAAGSPILAEEDIEEVFPLPVELVGNGPVFMLRVRGDSMAGAGIFDGDYVVVRRQPDANDGDFVAALVNGEEATVKRLRRRHGEVVLISENPAYLPMHFRQGVELLGKVVAVLRHLP